MLILYELIYRIKFQSTSLQVFFGRYKGVDSKVYIERQKPRIVNTKLKEKNNFGGLIRLTSRFTIKLHVSGHVVLVEEDIWVIVV